MISMVEDCYYLAIHRWKLGEAQSLQSISSHVADRTLPLFEVPPSSGWDYEHLRVFTAAEHIKFFGTRLGSFWPGRPVLIDAEAIDRQALRLDIPTHPLTALLERARQCHALAYPVISLRSTAEYVSAARQFLSRHDHLGFCMRINVSTFDAPAWQAKVEALIAALGQRPVKGILLIDAGPLECWDDDFVSLLVDSINQMPFIRQWTSVFFASTSFPERRFTAVGDIGRFPRRDASLYRALASRSTDLLRLPRFADYGPSYPSPFRKGGGIPRAHLRFTTGNDYLIAEGPSTEGLGFKAIFDVAKALVKQREFCNPDFSSGSAYFAALAREEIGSGNPAKWRSAAADHHNTLTVYEQASLHAFPLEPATSAAPEEQMTFSSISSAK